MEMLDLEIPGQGVGVIVQALEIEVADGVLQIGRLVRIEVIVAQAAFVLPDGLGKERTVDQVRGEFAHLFGLTGGALARAAAASQNNCA